MPAIWGGNFLLIHILKIEKSQNYFSALTKAILGKTLFIFLASSLMIILNLIPSALLPAMSYLQLITAFSAGLLVWGELKIEKCLHLQK